MTPSNEIHEMNMKAPGFVKSQATAGISLEGSGVPVDLDKLALNTYEVRAKLSLRNKREFLNGIVIAENAGQAKERAFDVLLEKYGNGMVYRIQIVKCLKKKLDFFIKKQQ
jgi:hypothetical protein